MADARPLIALHPDGDDARLDAQAEAEIDAGLGVPHEQVRAWLVRLRAGEKVDPPDA